MVVKLCQPIEDGKNILTHVSVTPKVIEDLVKLNMSMFFLVVLFEIVLFQYIKILAKLSLTLYIHLLLCIICVCI